MKWLLPALFALCLCPLVEAKKPKDTGPPPSLTGQRVIIPVPKGNASAAYWRPIDLEAMYRSRAEQSPEAAKDLETKLAGIPKGGRMWIAIETMNPQTANPRHFTVTVSDKSGVEITKVQGADEKPLSVNGRNWMAGINIELNDASPGPLKITVFNDFKKETTVYAVNLETGEVK